MVVVQLIHNLNLKLDLFNKIMLKNFLLIDDFDCEYIFGDFMPYLVYFSESAHANIGISQ